MYNKNNQNNRKKQDQRTAKRKLGDYGENIACMFLMKHNYKIIDRNYLKKYGEIDIIARKDTKYHFIEVKTVSRENTVIHETIDGYRPEDNVHSWKLRRLARTIEAYLLDKRLFDIDWELDIITVTIYKNGGKVAVQILSNVII